MTDTTNHFKRRLLARQGPQIGLWSCLADAGVTELLATTGYDWLLLDGEHAVNNPRTLIEQLRAGIDTECIVRPPVGDSTLIKQLLDIGAQTLLIPMVDTAEHAAALVRAVDFPPKGVRGVAAQTRGGRWGAVPNYFTEARDEICLIVQIESRTGLDNVAEIAAVDGIDALFVGPADLSASLGYLGQPNHPEVLAAIEHITTIAGRYGKPIGALTADENRARWFIDLGYDFIGIGMDTVVLRSSAMALRNRFAQLPAAPEKTTPATATPATVLTNSHRDGR